MQQCQLDLLSLASSQQVAQLYGDPHDLWRRFVFKKFRHKSARHFFGVTVVSKFICIFFFPRKVQLKLDIYRISRLSSYVGRVSGTKVLDFSMLLERGTIFRALILGQFFQIELSIHPLVSWNLPERLHSVLGPVSGSEEDLHRLRHGAVFIV